MSWKQWKDENRNLEKRLTCDVLDGAGPALIFIALVGTAILGTIWVANKLHNPPENIYGAEDHSYFVGQNHQIDIRAYHYGYCNLDAEFCDRNDRIRFRFHAEGNYTVILPRQNITFYIDADQLKPMESNILVRPYAQMWGAQDLPRHASREMTICYEHDTCETKDI